jgi:hypothetical protein
MLRLSRLGIAPMLLLTVAPRTSMGLLEWILLFLAALVLPPTLQAILARREDVPRTRRPPSSRGQALRMAEGRQPGPAVRMADDREPGAHDRTASGENSHAADSGTGARPGPSPLHGKEPSA